MIGISIIIPTFKRIDQTEKTIAKLLSSKGIGTDFTLELIVSDNTPDDSLKNHLQKTFHTFIAWVHPENNSIAGAKNFGARHATHPILIFCDSDIEVEEETLSNTVAALQNHPTAGMVGGHVLWRGGKRNGQTDRPRKEDRTYDYEGTTYIESLYSRYVATYKKVFEQVGGYDERVFGMRGEGSDLSIRYWRAGFPLVYDKNIVLHHIFDAPYSVAIRVEHPEWGIAKDLLLLGLKYDCFDGTAKNFEATVVANFTDVANPAYTMLEGIAKNIAFIQQSLPLLDKNVINPVYPFRFLEVFSDEALLKKSLAEAQERLKEITV